MSLSSWFRDYVYIPLGGNRKGTIILVRNIFIVWALTGIWHGANWTFVIWGLMFGIMLIIEKLFLTKHLEKMPSILQRIYVLFTVMISFIIFNANSIGEAWNKYYRPPWSKWRKLNKCKYSILFKKLFGGISNSDNWKHTITKKHNRKTKNKN